jgi:glycosyltransferase involved in cell wall biosynthesis
MNKNLISVLLPVFNAEKDINVAIQSILNQSYKDLELLIIDDGSTDNSYQICMNISEQDNRVKVFRNHNNLGLTKSLNLLINESNGKYLARQDADDWSEETRFEKQLKFMNDENIDVVYARSVRNDTQNIFPRLSYYLPLNFVLRYKNPLIHGTMLAKKNIIEKVGGYDEKFIYSQDYKLAFDLINLGFKLRIMKNVLYKSNFINNISTTKKKEQEYYANCVRKGIIPNQ